MPAWMACSVSVSIDDVASSITKTCAAQEGRGANETLLLPGGKTVPPSPTACRSRAPFGG